MNVSRSALWVTNLDLLSGSLARLWNARRQARFTREVKVSVEKITPLSQWEKCAQVIESTWKLGAQFQYELSLYAFGEHLFQGHVVVARWKDEVVGVATVVVSPAAFDVADFSWFAVARSWRGRGIGRRVMQAAADLAAEKKWSLFWASSEPDFYRKLGYTAVHEIAPGRHLYATTPSPSVDPPASEGEK